jgi:hypothetical protein
MDWLMARLQVISRSQPRFAALNVLSGLLCLGIMATALGRCFTAGVIVWKGTPYDVNGSNQKAG